MQVTAQRAVAVKAEAVQPQAGVHPRLPSCSGLSHAPAAGTLASGAGQDDTGASSSPRGKPWKTLQAECGARDRDVSERQRMALDYASCLHIVP